MKKMLFISTATALMLAACGDDSSNSANGNISEPEVSSSSQGSTPDKGESSSSTISSSSEKSDANTSSSSKKKHEENLHKISYGTMEDPRDGKTYKTITIDSTTWMLENLAYNKTYTDAIIIEDGTYLYQRNAAMDSLETGCGWHDLDYDWYCGIPDGYQGICPEGWHLPSKTDTKLLNVALQENAELSNIFLNTSISDSKECPESNAIWTTGEQGFGLFDGIPLCQGYSVGYFAYLIEYAAPVRCVLGQGADFVPPEPYDPPPSPKAYSGEYGEISDSRDGKTYKTVVIGEQTWMAENLNHYISDEESICSKDDPECEKFGRHYTWDAATKACPAGSHLPSEKEIRTLKAYLKKDWSAHEASELLRAAEDGWNDYPVNAYGFRALDDGTPYKCLNFDGEEFCSFTHSTVFWTTREGLQKNFDDGTTTIDSTYAETLWLMDCCYTQDSFFEKSNWASVRCIVDN